MTEIEFQVAVLEAALIPLAYHAGLFGYLATAFKKEVAA